jgi:small nuclear ribonucleoprotein
MPLPLDVLEKSVSKKMSLQLKDGRVLEGKLAGYDPYMNLVLEEAEERTEAATRRLGTVVLRGNNVVAITIHS